jgi:hypothetical protein
VTVARARRQQAEKEIVVPKGSNAVIVRTRDHAWVALMRDGAELLREQSGSRETRFVAEAGRYAVRTDGAIESVEPGTIGVPLDPFAPGPGDGPFLLRLTPDAPDRHVVDGIGEIPADGESSATITIEKVNLAGERLTRRGDNDEVFLRTTGGTVTAARKDERIRSVKLKTGQASFRLVAEPTPRLVTVSALGVGAAAPSEVQIEFV